MSDFLPHVREPSSGEPDVCVHCREEWVDLLTLYERDECSVRLRAEVERLREDVATFSDDFRRVTSETCAPDELHCSCVPHLRAAVEAARTEAATMRTWAEEAALAENENARDLEVARQERDDARRMLAECTVLSGADTDGNTVESGWVHLWRRAVDDVSQLRADYDDHSDIERAEREVDRLRGEAERERAAVVAWLNGCATEGFILLRINEACDAEKWALAIERGEHRREETK